MCPPSVQRPQLFSGGQSAAAGLMQDHVAQHCCRGSVRLRKNLLFCLLIFPIPWQYIAFCSQRQKCDLSSCLQRQRKMVKRALCKMVYMYEASLLVATHLKGTWLFLYFLYLLLHARIDAVCFPWNTMGLCRKRGCQCVRGSIVFLLPQTTHTNSICNITECKTKSGKRLQFGSHIDVTEGRKPLEVRKPGWFSYTCLYMKKYLFCTPPPPLWT